MEQRQTLSQKQQLLCRICRRDIGGSEHRPKNDIEILLAFEQSLRAGQPQYLPFCPSCGNPDNVTLKICKVNILKRAYKKLLKERERLQKNRTWSLGKFTDLNDSRWRGYCPHCKMEDHVSQMYVNDGDLYECETCHLQVQVLSLAYALRHKGIGKWRLFEGWVRKSSFDNDKLRPQFKGGMYIIDLRTDEFAPLPGDKFYVVTE